ncbi:1-phosphofructokinase family hexose kinase [Corynebacterium sp. sy017]|uniref:1-phosphofructokinase family hexose kinase n=1 Tax=unclassified Corynebacterium TaxID=2624378 RepID=UPI001186BCE5|nr:MULTISPECIES: 1-phosphofructokinase family hexose kinase [unclassified Corynebacterium]MBP3087910.1 1-phosphofructokinase family hexose kinase [Corynebacterium sp. sy017]TSD92451.1 1-phosphofructokinase family hexose kinase [Corynebacterium sp. SY003]
MIVTLTPNPSIDATVTLSSPLELGTVNRAQSISHVAGGKGINVSHAIHKAQKATHALFPAAQHDQFINLLEEIAVPYSRITLDDKVRVNTTITDPHGVTTKLNGTGPHLSSTHQTQLMSALLDKAAHANWVVLAGSLPQNTPVEFYATLCQVLRKELPHVRIAVDTSDAPLKALGKHLHHAAPNLLKPNGLELGQLVGCDGNALENAARQGNFSDIIKATHTIISRGVSEVLVTLGDAGALLATSSGIWHASPPPITVVSTVGAGDCCLAGYLMARAEGKTFAQALQQAVAYGSAATALPGTTIPTPELINTTDTVITELAF